MDMRSKYQDEDPVEIANDLLQHDRNRTQSPSSDAVEGAPGPIASDPSLDGQLGPDEISDPDEIVMSIEAKHHSEGK